MRASCLAVLASLLSLFGLATPTSAQTWSAEQQAVLAVVQQAWVDDLAEDLTWVERMAHPEVLSWGAEYPISRDRATARRWDEYWDDNSTALVHTIAPVGIVVRGDAAVVHYYAAVGSENWEGERETTTTRCADTLTRAGETWRYLGWFCMDEPTRD